MEIREESLQIAKQFKSNWVELAERLSQIETKKMFEEWGYESIETYGLKELRIKRPTLHKLLSSYYFLKKEEPKILEQRHEYEHFPQPDLVQVLSKAKESSHMSTDQYESFKDSMLEQELTKATAMKNLKEIDSSIGAKNETQRFQQTLGMVRRIASFLDEFEDVPENYFDALQEVEQFLQAKVQK